MVLSNPKRVDPAKKGAIVKGHLRCSDLFDNLLSSIERSHSATSVPGNSSNRRLVLHPPEDNQLSITVIYCDADTDF